MSNEDVKPTEPQNTDNLPREGVLLCLDYGSVRVGLASTSYEQTLAAPLETWTRSTAELDAKKIKEVCRSYNVVGLIVGLPMHMSGDEGGLCHEARQFGQWASETTGLPVTWWDERFSSQVADNFMVETKLTKAKRKAQRDKLAAYVILQSYLEGRAKAEQEPEE